MDAIIERIRKLQALAERAGTEAEAATAAARVQELLTKYNLEIGAVELKRQTGVDEKAELEFRRLRPHHENLARACVELFDVKWYYTWRRIARRMRLTKIHFIGLPANVSAACLTYCYLVASVESLVAGWKTGPEVAELENHYTPRTTLYRSFRIGAADRILEIATEYKRMVVAHSPGSEELVHIGNAVAEEMHSKIKFGPPRRVNYFVFDNPDGVMAGYKEGSRVDIHGARTNRMLSDH